MFNGMNPEVMKLAQEQMCRTSPADFARMQQQMLSNPDLIRMALETINNVRPEDFQLAADQMKEARPEEMAEFGKNMAAPSWQEIAAMNARIKAQNSYKLSAAQSLKDEGNALHKMGKFNDALQKYQLAKTNLSGLPSSEGRSLLKLCSTNLMSCYLKTGQYDECIKEGSEVLAYDAQNSKALFRRGQAYKELGRFQEAVADLNMVHEVDPHDDHVANVLRDAKEKLGTEGSVAAPRGLVIEEITEDVETVDSAADVESFSAEYSVVEPQETGDVLKSASEMMTEMDPKELQSMFGFASSMTGRDSFPTPASFNTPQPTFPASPFDFQEQMENLTNNPAMQQMMSSIIENMSPEMMANMGEQFGLEISREDAEKAKQAMSSSLEPESLGKMMLWLNRIQRGAELARKTKNWLLGNAGLIFAIVMLILAVVFYLLGFIGA